MLTDCKSHKVVVKGEKADPLKVLERIQIKSHRQVELLSPIPKPPEEKVPEEEKPKPKLEEKAVEVWFFPPWLLVLPYNSYRCGILTNYASLSFPSVQPSIVTVLKVHMHCEACSLELKRRIQRMKGRSDLIFPEQHPISTGSIVCWVDLAEPVLSLLQSESPM